MKVFFLTDSGKEEIKAKVEFKDNVIHIKSPVLVGLFPKKVFMTSKVHDEGFIISNGEDILISNKDLRFRKVVRVDGVEDGIKIYLPKLLKNVSNSTSRSNS